ncbi:aspartate aminotransferase family protein [Rhodothermaceae bacterium RA]|nr:aspartate aminotransferase family protein [Rhodothermaceae bacterium RA]
MPSDLDALRSEGDLNLSPHRQAWQTRHLDETARRLVEDDARYFLHQALSTPCLNALQACEGPYIEDVQGRRLLDFHGNNVHQVGFRHPRVMQAVVEQLQTLPFCTRRYTNDRAVALAKKLVELAPDPLGRVLFAPSGADAMSMALKLARAATGRYKTISMWESFHGATLDTISVGGEAIFRQQIGPLLPGTEHAPPPDAHHCLWDCAGTCRLKCAEYVAYMLEREGDVAAVVSETVRTTPFVPPPAYWQIIREACDRHGTLLILDEIPHSLGRTGRFFTFQHYDIVPDLVVIGKGLGGGVFPLAALIARADLNEVMADKALGHFTHEKNPVACAAALAAIGVIEDEGLMPHAAELGAYTLERMRAMMERHPLIGDVRGLGLLMGMELVTDRTTMARATDAAERVMYAALRRGLNVKLTQGNILLLTPALTITRAQMDEALAILDESLAEVEANPSARRP